MPEDGMSHERDPGADFFPDVLHQDGSRLGTAAGHYDGDGCTFPNPSHVVHNLTAEEYAATYADGEPHPEPPDLADLRAALADAGHAGEELS